MKAFEEIYNEVIQSETFLRNPHTCGQAIVSITCFMAKLRECGELGIIQEEQYDNLVQRTRNSASMYMITCRGNGFKDFLSDTHSQLQQ
ncbi:hypothetical protein [Diaphorobacter aerolatus]|uniref:Uncharacterized protein n=1 Tax=Diaphorobacter aerolatus TaxID=1288495 RepID=A0A7H0GJD6_9BURK|nr:hypothetical protein [Diaphorobacter aerolatus]QNP48402.1 hypothetical protein H9K75_21005 [Diaphorobacter aerolatus]